MNQENKRQQTADEKFAELALMAEEDAITAYEAIELYNLWLSKHPEITTLAVTNTIGKPFYE